MVKLKKIQKKKKKTTEEIAQEVESELEQSQVPERKKSVSFNKVISTGSTLLDLAISGKKIRGGGIPGGIMAEIFGPESSGKTGVLSEVSASAQSKGGDAKFLDPEARLDKEYATIYGLSLSDKGEDYDRPDTVKQMFDIIWNWEPKNESKDIINVISADSLAALSTEMEMEDEDKMGMKRAKDFSEGLRKSCRMLANKNWLLFCSNQLRESTKGGADSPGGKAIKFYASLRIKIVPNFKNGKITKEKTLKSKVKVKHIAGINCTCKIVKSSIDNPFREAPISIVFNYGIDDVRANLQWYKEMTGSSSFYGGDLKTIDKAIQHIEDNDLENELKEKVIDLWEEIEDQFTIKRKKKKR